jgi:hypothetical protein
MCVHSGRVHNTGSSRWEKKPARKAGETVRLTGTFFPRVGWAGRNLGKPIFLLPSRSGKSGFREYRPVANGIFGECACMLLTLALQKP